MRGLRDLNVKLVDLCTNSTVDLVSMLEADVETELWEPVKAVLQPRQFVIETNLREKVDVELENAPFEVVRLPGIPLYELSGQLGKNMGNDDRDTFL